MTPVRYAAPMVTGRHLVFAVLLIALGVALLVGVAGIAIILTRLDGVRWAAPLGVTVPVGPAVAVVVIYTFRAMDAAHAVLLLTLIGVESAVRS